MGVWAKVVFPTGIYMNNDVHRAPFSDIERKKSKSEECTYTCICTCTCKSWLLWVSNGGMASLSVHMYIGAGGVR